MFNKKLWNQPINVSYQNNFSAQQKHSSWIITQSDVLHGNVEYQKIKEIVSSLIESGLSRMGEGYCISVSDIIFNQLNQIGIKAHLMEVQLSAKNNIDNETYLVGFDTTIHQNSHEKVNTHVVVVTDTEIPMIIDMSIAHRLPSSYQCIIEKAVNEGDKVICSIEKDGWIYTYQEKKTGIGIPQLHQISILERIATDKKMGEEILELKKLNYVGIGLSIFALVNVLLKMFDVF